MNIEKIYKDLKEINKAYDNDKIKDILAEMQQEIITSGKINKGVVSAFKNITKIVDGVKPVFKQIFQADNDNYCICNGYLLIDFTENIENIPEVLRAYIDYKEPNYAKPTLTFDRLKNSNRNKLKTAKININDMQKIIAYNKINKENKIPFAIGDEVIFNAEYMQWILNIAKFKDYELNVVYFDEKSPIEMEFENCKAMLLPLRHGNKEAYENTLNKIKEILNWEVK